MAARFYVWDCKPNSRKNNKKHLQKGPDTQCFSRPSMSYGVDIICTPVTPVTPPLMLPLQFKTNSFAVLPENTT